MTVLIIPIVLMYPTQKKPTYLAPIHLSCTVIFICTDTFNYNNIFYFHSNIHAGQYPLLFTSPEAAQTPQLTHFLSEESFEDAEEKLHSVTITWN